ncbi:hypothetical protein [Clostridium weizhouense]|uniref:ATP synthase subunit I n=1 Tax=Clostridium weizhouense TaxID=2859781 RepID=A0ABS7ALD0_9CLOT|nr:hypothetical protein [Clostridium weizhouense]MBW6408898.1 hypothetical protein [Clostridium weizhouense]
MNNENVKLLRDMIKIDLGIGIIMFFIICLFSSLINGIMYFGGILISLLNFILSVYITLNFLEYNKRNKYTPIITFFKIAIIIIIAIPFIKSITLMFFYMFGFISHYILLIINCIKNIKNRKGSV